jgi:hypothetical protein
LHHFVSDKGDQQRMLKQIQIRFAVSLTSMLRQHRLTTIREVLDATFCHMSINVEKGQDADQHELLQLCNSARHDKQTQAKQSKYEYEENKAQLEAAKGRKKESNQIAAELKYNQCLNTQTHLSVRFYDSLSKFVNIIPSMLDEDQRELRSLTKAVIESSLDMEFHVPVCGMTSAGKSTLLNSIIGQRCLATKESACTSLPVRIKHSPTLQQRFTLAMGEGKPANLHLKISPVLNVLVEFMQRLLVCFSNVNSTLEKTGVGKQDWDSYASYLTCLPAWGRERKAVYKSLTCVADRQDDFKIVTREFQQNYNGHEEVVETINAVNDLLRCVNDIDNDLFSWFISKVDLNFLPLLSLEFDMLKSKVGQQIYHRKLPAVLILYDTPGRSEDLGSASNDLLDKIITQSRKVIYVEDPGNLNSAASTQFRSEIMRSLSKNQHDRSSIVLLYNKLDAHDKDGRGDPCKAAKKNASQGDVPQAASDMAVKGKSPEGKLVLGVLSWKVHPDSFHVTLVCCWSS